MKTSTKITKLAQMTQLGLVVGLFSLAGACGTKDKDDDPPPAAASVAYSTIATIVETSCAAAGCHDSTTPPDFKTGGKTTFDQYKATSLTLINATDNTVMPKTGSAGAAAFSADDKAAVLKYLNQ